MPSTPCLERIVWYLRVVGGTGADNASELRAYPMDKWGVQSEMMLSDTRVIDLLIQNSDR